MRRFIVVALVAGLLGGALVGPVDAKKKKPKPVKFSTTGTLVTSNPLEVEAETGVTRTEFLNSCSVPQSQGLDGYVIELPEKVTKKNANVTLSGTGQGIVIDLDMYFFSATCESTGAISTEALNEAGLMAAGTKFVLVSAYFGHDIDFTFSSVSTK